MVENTLKLIKKLRANGKFEFNAQTKKFNPLEKFVDKVIQNENTHSEILFDLLNPNGSHKQGDIFLKEFLFSVLDSTNEIDIDALKIVFIKREFDINEFGETGRIDLYIELSKPNKKHIGIIIENKINNAVFQENQLGRYKKAITNKIKNENNVYLVCIPKYRNTEINEKCRVIHPDELASILERALHNCKNTDVKTVMASYITCLRNIDINNTIMNNSSVLLKLLEQDSNNHEGINITLNDIKELINAYDALPGQYLETIKTKLEVLKNDYPKLECRIGYTINNYLDVWEDDVYREQENWQWLSMKADHNCLRIFLVSNEKDNKQSDMKAGLIGYYPSEKYGGNMWYKPKDATEFQIDFNGQIPKFEDIVILIKNLLEKLRSVTDKYANFVNK